MAKEVSSFVSLHIFRPYRSCDIVQSHSFNTLGNRRLSLAALPVVPAASCDVKLPLLADTRSVFQSL